MQLSQNLRCHYATVVQSSVSLCLTTQLSPNLVCHYATVAKILVLLRNCHQNMVSFGGGPKVGKGTKWCIGPSRAKVLSYIGVLARGWAACAGHVASQYVAMSAIWLPKGHHGGPKLVRFGVLGLLCRPCGQEACMWKGENSDFDDSCMKTRSSCETNM